MIRACLLALLLGFSSLAFSDAEVWLQVDTQTAKIKIKRGEKTIAILKHIAIGRKGAGFKRTEGDDITPLGRYKIGWINEQSRYRTFLGFNYPTAGQARKALKLGLIDLKTYKKIVKAHENNTVPPQNTRLGGQIGIHGLGEADPGIHDMFNWTHGCIALTNRQIDYLSRWVHEGTVVEVK